MYPLSLAVGDFSEDGKLDLAVASDVSNTVSLLLGNADGTSQGAVNYSTRGKVSKITSSVGD